MASTTNLKITKLNSADYVSVDPINEALDIIDKLGAVYVTAAGEADGWYYIKLSNGFAFCATKGTGTTTAGTDRYYFRKNYPFSFSSEPIVTGSAGSSEREASGIKYVGGSAQATTACDLWMSTDSTDAGRTWWIYVMAFGKIN